MKASLYTRQPYRSGERCVLVRVQYVASLYQYVQLYEGRQVMIGTQLPVRSGPVKSSPACIYLRFYLHLSAWLDLTGGEPRARATAHTRLTPRASCAHSTAYTALHQHAAEAKFHVSAPINIIHQLYSVD